MRDLETTNGLLDRIERDIATLIEWADADADLSTQTDARGQARADFARATSLRKAREILKECRR